MRALVFALAATGSGVVACAPLPEPEPATYELCEEAGCGDEVNIVIENDTAGI